MQIVCIIEGMDIFMNEMMAERKKSRNAASEIKSREMKQGRQKRMDEETFSAEINSHEEVWTVIS